MDLTARIVTLELAETFVISRESRDTEDVVQVTLTCSGVHGHGEAAPIERYEESHDSALAYLEENAGLIGDDPFAIEEIMARLPAREQAARAADTSLDVDLLIVTKAIVNEGPKLKRWMPAAMGRATPIAKRTSHIEIVVAEAAR